jgi:hypothetical protein
MAANKEFLHFYNFALIQRCLLKRYRFFHLMRLKNGHTYQCWTLVGSRNLNTFIHVFRKLQNFAGIKKMKCEFDLFRKWVGSGRDFVNTGESGRQKLTRVKLSHIGLLVSERISTGPQASIVGIPGSGLEACAGRPGPAGTGRVRVAYGKNITGRVE